jgi:hypothetical protein
MQEHLEELPDIELVGLCDGYHHAAFDGIGVLEQARLSEMDKTSLFNKR